SFFRFLDEQQFRGFWRVDQGEQAQEQDRPVRCLLGANRAAVVRLEEDPLSGRLTCAMLSTFPEIALEGLNRLDPNAAELREELAEIATHVEESLGVVAEYVIEQRR